MGSFPLPNYTVQQPAAPDPLGQYGKFVELRSMLNQQALQPLVEQETQQKVQSNQLAIAAQEQKLQSQKALADAWSDPDFSKTITASPSGAGFDAPSMVRELIKRGVLPEDAQAQANGLLDISKTQAAMTKDQLANYKDSHQQLAQLLGPVTDIKDPDQAAAALAAAKTQVAKIPGLDAHTIQMVQQADVQHLEPMLNMLNVTSQIGDYHKANAEEATAQSDAIKAQNAVAPVTPEHLSTFQNVIVPGYKALAPEQQQALVAEANQARTVGELQDIMKRGDEMDKTQQMHKDSLAQTAALAGQRFSDKGLEANDKGWTDPQHGYLTIASQVDAAKNLIKAGADGNGLATSIGSTMVVLGVNSFNQTHRISPAEAQAAAMPGGLAERFNAWADKALTGKISPQLAKEGNAIMSELQTAAYNRQLTATQLHSQGYNIDPKHMPAMLLDGTVTTLDKALASRPTVQSTAIARPSNATHTGIGSVDKKKHWLDAGGHDLGPAE